MSLFILNFMHLIINFTHGKLTVLHIVAIMYTCSVSKYSDGSEVSPGYEPLKILRRLSCLHVLWPLLVFVMKDLPAYTAFPYGLCYKGFTGIHSVSLLHMSLWWEWQVYTWLVDSGWRRTHMRPDSLIFCAFNLLNKNWFNHNLSQKLNWRKIAMNTELKLCTKLLFVIEYPVSQTHFSCEWGGGSSVLQTAIPSSKLRVTCKDGATQNEAGPTCPILVTWWHEARTMPPWHPKIWPSPAQLTKRGINLQIRVLGIEFKLFNLYDNLVSFGLAE